MLYMVAAGGALCSNSVYSNLLIYREQGFGKLDRFFNQALQ